MRLRYVLRSCMGRSRMIEPFLCVKDNVRVALIPPDLLLQRPKHPEHECHGWDNHNEK